MKPPSHRQAILRQVAEGRLSPKEAARLLLEAAPPPGHDLAESSATSAQAEAADSAIAIIGYAGQFPGARDVREFWENLAAGRDSVTTAPLHRDAWRGVAAGQYHGGFLEQYDLFDPLFFNTSPKEAEVMDPQQRLFLLEVCRALADAGYSRDALKGSRTGVFAGCQGGDYVHLLEAGQAPDSYGFLGNLTSILPARVAYFFDFKGPCLAVDTACSSSLVAVHLASESLRKGESELALAGGVSVLATPRFHAQATASEMLAPDGRCKTFDAAADGFVPAEGVGVVVLKRLDKALADGDSIRGIIRGSAINQDGRSNGISAPNGPSQSALECAVYNTHGIDPATLGYVEAHGTGTRLGDPIEFDALTEAFRRYTDQRRFCAIGSVKSNIGHALTASGVAGLIKLLLCLKHRELVPSLHFHKGNGSIDFENSPFYVNTRRIPWHPPAGVPRRAAISAFGLSGTNCHIVIEEPAAPRPAAGSEWPWPGYLVTLSARTDTALARYAADLKAWLEGVGQTERLIDIAFTLQVGRDDYPYRLAFVVRDPADLLARLDAAVASPPVAKASSKALDEAAAATARHWLESGANGVGTAEEALERLHRLAELYRLGHALPWEKLYAGRDCRRVSLPGYPFELRRCWLP
ncbi:beta-ketoacyl synthase N-terminal-like domain-containing protein, partial [Methylomagnum sp.]